MIITRGGSAVKMEHCDADYLVMCKLRQLIQPGWGQIRHGLRLFCALTCLFAGITQAGACPLVEGLVDFNCDQAHKILFTGDSLVDGIGDERGQGGYVNRLDEVLELPQVVELGIPGITTQQLLRYYKRHFFRVPDDDATRNLAGVDLLIIDVGRNDFWDHGDPSLTVRNISRIIKFLRKQLSQDGAAAPYFAVATLAPTTRGFQRPFIDEVNRLLLEAQPDYLPVFVRFDTLNADFISVDGIHPSAKGYNKLKKIALSYIRGEGKSQMQALRGDTDKDGLYDDFEAVKFGTDPANADCDEDALGDGAELFTYLTDPLDIDSDDDGVDDGVEILAGTDPLDGQNF